LPPEGYVIRKSINGRRRISEPAALHVPVTEWRTAHRATLLLNALVYRGRYFVKMTSYVSHTNQGIRIMPKLIVLFFGAESPAVTLAEAATEGAKGVRFTEVDLRSGGAHEATTTRRHKRLESSAQIRDYDGVILACPAAGDIPAELSALLDQLEASSSDALANTVFGIIGGENTTLPGRVLRLGGLLVGAPAAVVDPETRALRLGARVATVVEWVRHALSHEHGHHETEHHHHSHDEHGHHGA
jgi:hypothetical protein